jgi:hypothetical protein
MNSAPFALNDFLAEGRLHFSKALCHGWLSKLKLPGDRGYAHTVRVEEYKNQQIINIQESQMVRCHRMAPVKLPSTRMDPAIAKAAEMIA